MVGNSRECGQHLFQTIGPEVRSMSIQTDLNSKKGILAIYIILGVGIWTLNALFISEDIYPPMIAYLVTLGIAGVFYVFIAKFIANPSVETLNSAKFVFYVFIIGWVGSLAWDIIYWGALYYTSLLGAILAVGGIGLVFSMLNAGTTYVSSRSGISSGGVAPMSGGGPKGRFCRNCGSTIGQSDSFCNNCGKSV